MSNWRDVLKAQYADLQRLEDLDKELDVKNVTANIDKVLSRPSSSRFSLSTQLSNPKVTKRDDFIDIEPQPEMLPEPLPPPYAHEYADDDGDNASYASARSGVRPSSARRSESGNFSRMKAELEEDDTRVHSTSPRVNAAKATSEGNVVEANADTPETPRAMDSNTRL